MSLLKGIRGKWRVFGGLFSMRAAGVDFKDVFKETAVRFSSCLVSPRPRDGEEESSERGQRVPRGSAELVNPQFVNRNPRNLERMSLAMKDRGWETVWPRRACWHRLCIEHSQHHVSAHVEHVPSGEVVVSASTQEWAVKRHLYSTRDVLASESVGRVLAQRCLESGVQHLHFRAVPWSYKTERMQKFRAALKEGGIILSEPRRIYK
ncbi:large ribosomal subunit protein uL18m [Acipenser ruthenus]|uniref:large ribosomal subunit protein uL18m n=1 Tax=Acipenser ruthenus TaxID=7906 RepID=UPI0027415AA2|nr:large ribosomal subunit protein uL18m [Acipenser ruthenus]